MPTTHSIGLQTSSASVPSVNLTGEAMFGRPFRVTQQYGQNIMSTAQVWTGSASNFTLVSLVSFTTGVVQG
jgi:hypothetical protein